MTSKEALIVLRCAYEGIITHDLTDEEVNNYRNIGNSIIYETFNELKRRKINDKDSESKG